MLREGPFSVRTPVEPGLVGEPDAHHFALASCPICDLWLEPWQSCLHIPAPTPCAELPATVEPFDVASCAVAGLSHVNTSSAGGA
jgi:hypothetical protein